MTTFFLTHEIDTGKIIRQRHLPIADTDDVETVHDALMVMGAGLVTETVDLLLDGKQTLFPKRNSIRMPPSCVRPEDIQGYLSYRLEPAGEEYL